MSTLTCEVSQNAPPACLFAENPNRLMSLLDVYQIYAHRLLVIFDELRSTEILLSGTPPRRQTADEEKILGEQFGRHLAHLRGLAAELELRSAQKQVERIIQKISGQIVAGPTIAPMLNELRTRICEDLESHVYFFVPERSVDKAFKKDEEGRYIVKTASELMDHRVIERFPSTSDDIEDCYRCFAFRLFPAAMFHLMRVLEVAVLEVGEIAGVKDVKPSWGSVLQQVERVVLKTRYDDLPESVKPHRQMLEAILPQMQAIQRAWRNKFSHVESKIVPTEPIDEKVATQILVAVEAFISRLVLELPMRNRIEP